MKTLLATALTLLFVLSGTAWAEGHGHHDGHRGGRIRAPRDPGPDLDGDGRVTNFERIQYERKQRFERLRGR